MTGFAQLTFDSGSIAISQPTSVAQLRGKQVHEETILPRPVGNVLWRRRSAVPKRVLKDQLRFGKPLAAAAAEWAV